VGQGNPTAAETAGAPRIAEAGSPVSRILGDSPIRLTLVAKSAEALTLVALATVIPRALGPADYGLFAVVLAVVGIVSMSLSLGGPLLLSRFVPAAPAAEREVLALALALRIARFRALMVLAAIALVAVLAVVVPERFPTAAALFVSIALVLDVAATLLYQVALALGRPRLWSFRFPLQNTLLVVAALALHATAGVEARSWSEYPSSSGNCDRRSRSQHFRPERSASGSCKASAGSSSRSPSEGTCRWSSF
jgi:hypothetical protein